MVINRGSGWLVELKRQEAFGTAERSLYRIRLPGHRRSFLESSSGFGGFWWFRLVYRCSVKEQKVHEDAPESSIEFLRRCTCNRVKSDPRRIQTEEIPKKFDGIQCMNIQRKQSKVSKQSRNELKVLNQNKAEEYAKRTHIGRRVSASAELGIEFWLEQC